MERTITAGWVRRGRLVPQGSEVSVKGVRGRYRLRQHVRLADGREWLDLVSPERGYLSVRPERIRVVHRNRALRPVRAELRALVGGAA